LNPNPVILFAGDEALCRRDINRLKSGVYDVWWQEFSADDVSEDAIRAACGSGFIGFENAVVLIKDLPNRKHFREFLLNLIDTSPPYVRIILWDSHNYIKDTSSPLLAWKEFVKAIKGIKGSRIIDHGLNFGNKWRDRKDVSRFVIDAFSSHSRKINADNALLFADLVGNNRAMLLTEIEKLSMVAPKIISEGFILENTFPSSQEAVLYKIGELIDNRKTAEAVHKLQEFQQHGVFHGVIVDVLVRKARLQLAAAHMWLNGLSDSEISDKLMQMGRFPANVWHSSMPQGEKQVKAAEAAEDISAYMARNGGLPEKYFGERDAGCKTSKDGYVYMEALPHKIVADKAVAFVHRVEAAYRNKSSDYKKKVFYRFIRIYLSVLESMKRIRYDNSQVDEELSRMVFVLSGVMS